MPEETEMIYDVSEADFEERVLQASSQRPVVVDFWAPWCAPCRMLGPLLDKVLSSFGGRMVLAKLNIDEAQGLAARYGVRGIPAVKIFRNGQVVAEFVGLRGENEIRQILSQVMPSEADEIAEGAAGAERSGDSNKAESLYRKALTKAPDHPGALLGLARLSMGKGDLDAACESSSRVAEDAPERKNAEGLLARLDFLRDCTRRRGREAAEKAAADRPDDLDAMCGLAACLAAEEKYEQALAAFLRVLERDKHYGEGAARDAMVRIFGIVGQRSTLADDYRSRLARVLY